MMERYKHHVIDQALTMLKAHESIKCLFTTPKLLEALCERISLKKAGITGVFCGGTEMTPQFHRFAVEELMEGAHFAPTYGNTLMGLAPQAAGQGRQLGDHLLPAGSARHDRGRGSGQPDEARRLRRDRPRPLHDSHQRVLHAAFPGARRVRARSAVREVSVGWRPKRPARSRASKNQLSKECIPGPCQ